MTEKFPRLERTCDIEIPSPRRGRPSYRWVPGWIVRYSETRTSIPMRYNDARNTVNEIKKGAS